MIDAPTDARLLADYLAENARLYVRVARTDAERVGLLRCVQARLDQESGLKEGFKLRAWLRALKRERERPLDRRERVEAGLPPVAQ